MITHCSIHKELYETLKQLEESYSNELIKRDYVRATVYIDAIKKIKNFVLQIKNDLVNPDNTVENVEQ